MFYVPITVTSVKDHLFWQMELFLYKNHMFDQHMQNNNNYVFW